MKRSRTPGIVELAISIGVSANDGEQGGLKGRGKEVKRDEGKQCETGGKVKGNYQEGGVYRLVDFPRGTPH